MQTQTQTQTQTQIQILLFSQLTNCRKITWCYFEIHLIQLSAKYLKYHTYDISEKSSVWYISEILQRKKLMLLWYTANSTVWYRHSYTPASTTNQSWSLTICGFLSIKNNKQKTNTDTKTYTNTNTNIMCLLPQCTIG